MNSNNNKTFYAKAGNTNGSFNFKDIFKNVFKKHSKEDLEEVMVGGTAGHIPEQNELLNNWQRPWVFFRVLIFGIVAFALIFFTLDVTQACDYISLGAIFIIGAAVAPLSLLFFFYELNIPRNIPLHRIAIYSVIGGVSCALVCRIIYLLFNLNSATSEIVAGGIVPGISEEITKTIVIAIILGRNRKYCYGLNGLLIGAAVGTGFAIFETNGYALAELLESQNLETVKQVLVIRGISSIAGHTAYSAMCGGALALVKGRQKLAPKHFGDPTFLISFFCAVIIHSVWDILCTDTFVNKMASSSYGKNLLLLLKMYHFDVVIFVAIEYFIVLWLLRKCIQQIMFMLQKPQMPNFAGANANVPVHANAGGAAVHAAAHKIECLSGEYTGSVFSIGNAKPITIGRSGDCTLRLANDTKGISGHHCCIGADAEGIYLKDLGSTYGTLLADGTRIQPQQKIRLRAGDTFALASEKCKFKVIC